MNWNQLRIIKKETHPKAGTVHYKLKQYIHDIPVYGAEQTIHINKKREKSPVYLVICSQANIKAFASRG
ncbi:hypothetical protein P7H21_21580 [Paenibacillus larvae]|nr:hypothetical protein [Paenibacillus larvae]MDT2306005.1 hypothetical protein [Paenibacillus larvae]